MAKNNLEFVFDVKPDGGETYRLWCRSKVLGKWEQTFRGASLANLEKPKVSDLQAIAMVGAIHEEKYTGNLNTFRESHEIDLRSELDMFTEDAIRDENRRRKENDEEPMTPLEERKFEKRFRKENEDLDESEQESPFGSGPTQ